VRRVLELVLLAAAVPLCVAAPSPAASLVPIGKFAQPIFVASAPANPDELLVVEREGRVVQMDDGTSRLYGDLAAMGIVSCCASERGLLSIAPAADFASSGRFYAAYTGTPVAGGEEGDVHVDAFHPGGSASGTLLREPILSIPHAAMPNHNGGQLEIGPDGYLYVSVGDGGGTGVPLESGQDLETLLGKLLRIEPRPGDEPPYAIPPDNPFVGLPGRDEIWAYGLRNPWRFSFDRLSGDTIVADVGQGLREEVDFAPSPAPGTVGGGGANYGWNCREGSIAYPAAPMSCLGADGFVDPVFDYPHDDPGGDQAHGCAIIGGYVVHDANLGSLDGRYVYSDSCSGEIRSLTLPGSAGAQATEDRSEGLEVAGPTSFGEDSCGRLYVASGDGTVYRIDGSAGASCPRLVQGGPPVGAQRTTILKRKRRIVIRLGVRRRPHSRTAKLVASVSPCQGLAGARVQLRRGGHGIASKRLSTRCIARFRVRLSATATFRAVFRGQRSQVRTIALAKPNP
jgi:hypothetical protein